MAIASVHSLPTFVGPQPKYALQQWLYALVDQIGLKLKGLDAQCLPQEAESQEFVEDPRCAEAESKLNQSDFDGAMAVYDSILSDEPDNAEIRQARNTTQLLKRLDPANRTTDPIAAAQQEPENIDAQFNAADEEIVAGNPDARFDRLIALIAGNVAGEKDRVRDRLL